uniref:BED-type domain-containing protein n=1 Tax=Caenorhabditis tropicalis TaxID=1561998 RepID=A0A1I7TYK2_9PELO
MMTTTTVIPDTIMRTGLAPAPNIPNPRNAGRKKSNPVWEFFTDLRTHGLAGVRCRFCHWVTNDRSPTTMKFHLKRKHDTGPGGLWAICEEKINSQAPANYAPRVKKQPDDLLLKALTQPSAFSFNPFATAEIKLGAQDDFLTALIQQASQYANSSTSPSANSNEGNASNENESLTSDSVFLSKLSSTYQPTKEEDSSSSSVSGSTSTTSTEFHLNDGSSIAALLQIATDSDLVFTFNARKLGEYCFESDAKNKKMVTLTDCGNEIRVIQLENDEEIRVEMWRKSDWQQFTWAVRGSCLHFLKSCSDMPCLKMEPQMEMICEDSE